MLIPDYPVRTERLDLRPFTDDDFAALYAYHSRQDVTRYLYFGPRDEAGTREALAQKRQRTALRARWDALNLAVVVRETGALVGDVLLIWTNAEHRQGEVGYVFHPDHAGRGYATEATRAMLRLGFDDLGLHRIVGRLDARNTASAGVLEGLGMRREAHLRENERVKGEWCDELVYALLAREWRAAR
jgi:RimJ/RimL family protein N-acetyltransferase